MPRKSPLFFLVSSRLSEEVAGLLSGEAPVAVAGGTYTGELFPTEGPLLCCLVDGLSRFDSPPTASVLVALRELVDGTSLYRRDELEPDEGAVEGLDNLLERASYDFLRGICARAGKEASGALTSGRDGRRIESLAAS